MSLKLSSQFACIAGTGFVVYACWMAWPPLAFAVLGAILIAFGVFAHRLAVKSGSIKETNR